MEKVSKIINGAYLPSLTLKSRINDRANEGNVFTSMFVFVERMEVLEYRRKFEVALSTFPDPTNTEMPRKLVFRVKCMRVCVSVCVRKSLSVDILRMS